MSKYIAEISFYEEKNCRNCPMWDWDIMFCKNQEQQETDAIETEDIMAQYMPTCKLKPMPDSVTDTEQATMTLSNGKAWVTVPANPHNPQEPVIINSPIAGPPEPTNADILAAIRDVKECMRQLQQGERIGL